MDQGDKLKYDLTICSVSFRSSFYLDLNWRLTNELNGGKLAGKWIVIENTSVDETNGRLNFKDARFEVLAGVVSPQMNKYRASYHHGAALNKVIASVKTRFVLILDPDFFIVKRDWINEVIGHMVDNDIDFLGAPWHPRWYRKYRYFPCLHCLFMDLDKLPVSDINFLPDLLNNPHPFASKLWTVHAQLWVEGKRRQALGKVLENPWRFLVEDLRQRRLIGSSRDTGYYLYQKYGPGDQLKSESFKPVFRRKTDYLVPPGVSCLQKSMLVELLLPDRLAYIPKRKNYFTETGFRELGYADVRSLGWEEFIWRDRPFGFHIRSSLQQAHRAERKDAAVIPILESLTGLKMGSPNRPPFHGRDVTCSTIRP